MMDRRIVYDSAAVQPGRCPTCGKRLDRCTCGSTGGGPSGPSVPKDGIIRLRCDRKGRGGKTVTLVTGLTGNLEALARELKKLCGTGGTLRGDVVEIQGDHRDRLAEALRQRGYTVKLAGG
jgi:translation initiation factor 1